jgi:hypothetical protein
MQPSDQGRIMLGARKRGVKMIPAAAVQCVLARQSASAETLGSRSTTARAIWAPDPRQIL